MKHILNNKSEYIEKQVKREKDSSSKLIRQAATYNSLNEVFGTTLQYLWDRDQQNTLFPLKFAPL